MQFCMISRLARQLEKGKGCGNNVKRVGRLLCTNFAPLCTAIYIFILRATKSRQGGKGEEEGQLPECTIVRTPTH